MTGFADWLFYDQKIGISVALFLGVLGGLSLLTNPVHAGLRQWLLAAAVLLLGLASVVEEFNALSASLAVLAVAVAISSLTNPLMDGLRERYAAVRDLLLTGPFRIFADIAQSSRFVADAEIFHRLGRSAALKLRLPAAVLIGQSADRNLAQRHRPEGVAGPAQRPAADVLERDAVRGLAVHLSEMDSQAPPAPWASETEPRGPDEPPSELFGAAAILRSLLLFNLLFAVQTALDVVYLWGGVALPDGLTYAAYAHRGAYPLIVTALLAAGFVLAAMRPGGPAERMPVIRMLVFLWIAQNVMLVVSSMLRLDLYVQIYSLTYWRIAALIWMLLVAAGLILIVARIAFDRSNSWLVRMNLATLALMACICAFINFPYVIADLQCGSQQGRFRRRPGAGFQLSRRPRPASAAGDRSLSRGAAKSLYPGSVQDDRPARSACNRHIAELNSWRAWSFRGYRLKRYITAAGLSPAQASRPAPKGDKG